MARKVLIFTLIAILAISLVGCSKGDNSEVVAIVNGENITRGQLDKRVEQTAAMNGFDLSNPQMAPYLEIFELQVLDSLVDEVLLKQEAEKLNIKVTKEEVDQEIDLYKSQFSSEKEYKEYFNKYLKMSDQDIRDILGNQVLFNALFDEITKDITSPQVDLKGYYNENKEQFYEPEQVKARHILLETKEEAEAIIKQIVEEDKDMAELAVLKSTDPSAKVNEGDLGYFTRGRMVEPFEEAAFAMEIGEVSTEPVETIHGFHVIRVEDKKEAKQLTFEEIKDELEENLIYEAKNQKFYEYMFDLREEAEIINKLEEEFNAKQQEESTQEEVPEGEENQEE